MGSHKVRLSEHLNTYLGLVAIFNSLSPMVALFLLVISNMFKSIGFSDFMGHGEQGAKYVTFCVPLRVHLIVIQFNRRGIEKSKDMKMATRPVDVCVLPDKNQILSSGPCDPHSSSILAPVP